MTTKSHIEHALGTFFDEPKLNNLPLEPIGSIREVRKELDEDGMPVIGFCVYERKGTGDQFWCRANPGQFAFLLTTQVMGISLFINFTDGTPFLKMGGHMSSKAGITVGRILAGYEAGEDATYINRNRLDLRHANLGSRNNPRTERGREEIYAELMSLCDAANFERYKDLLHRAFDYLDEERSKARKRK